MELWIRSQDKKIMEKATTIKVEQNAESHYEDGKDIIKYKNVVIVNNNYVYGTYKTMERALEVLDDIERFIISINHEIYQMPEE